MNRRQFLTAGAGLSLSCLVGCDSKQDTPAPQEIAPKQDVRVTVPNYNASTAEGLLAKELSKWEPWILNIVETDYSAPRRPVRLQIEKDLSYAGRGNPEERVEGAYNALTNKLSLKLQTITSTLDHELGHVIDDSMAPYFGLFLPQAEIQRELERSANRYETALGFAGITDEERAQFQSALQRAREELKKPLSAHTHAMHYTGPSRNTVERHLYDWVRRPAIAQAFDKRAPRNADGERNSYFDGREYIARAVNGLMKLTTALEDIPEGFPLEAQDLALFEQMKYDNKPMFGKAIAKYRLKQEMLKTGISEAQLTDLPYATHVEWREKSYEFPALNVEFKALPKE